MDTAGLHLRCDGRAIESGQTHRTKSLLAKYWGGHDTVVPPFLLPSKVSLTFLKRIAGGQCLSRSSTKFFNIFRLFFSLSVGHKFVSRK